MDLSGLYSVNSGRSPVSLSLMECFIRRDKTVADLMSAFGWSSRNVQALLNGRSRERERERALVHVSIRQS